VEDADICDFATAIVEFDGESGYAIVSIDADAAAPASPRGPTDTTQLRGAVEALVIEADDPEVEAIFVDDMVNAFRGRCLAMVDDARLLGRDWGFRLADVKVPVRWWHGEADHVVPIAGVHTAVSRLQDAELTVRAESHLGGFAMIDEVLESIRVFL
jgi:pimeloyl-ACP methyl ester carboxylesterase